jgi:hypothetical protein
MDYWWTRFHTFSCTFTIFLVLLTDEVSKKNTLINITIDSQTLQVENILVDNIKVPSVTTILSAKDKRFLEMWRRKVGDAEADRIMRQALLLEQKCTKF